MTDRLEVDLTDMEEEVRAQVGEFVTFAFPSACDDADLAASLTDVLTDLANKHVMAPVMVSYLRRLNNRVVMPDDPIRLDENEAMGAALHMEAQRGTA